MQRRFSWNNFIVISTIIMFILLILSLGQGNITWILRSNIGYLVKKKEFLESRYQELLVEESKLTSYTRIKKIAEEELKMRPCTSTPTFLKSVG